MNMIMSGTVGSTAYGLAHDGSDIDTLGMFAAPTTELHGLRRPPQSIVTTDPDTTLHEAGKAVKLMLGSNPTAMELLWLDTYTELTPLGHELITLRRAFLSREGVRKAYLGYAHGQFRKLQQHSKLSSLTNPRRAQKHALHLVRLLVQGTELHRTGKLVIQLPDPEEVHILGLTVHQDPSSAEELLRHAEEVFQEPGYLPLHTDEAAVEAWLHRVRDHYYERPA